MSISVCHYSDNLFTKQTKRTNEILTLPLCAGKNPSATQVHAGPEASHTYM